MKKIRRQQIWIDPAVQWAIVRRVIVYIFSCALFITLPMVIMWEITHPSTFLVQHIDVWWKQLGVLLFAITLLLPMAVYDVVRWSHRFSGPIYRVRRELERLADGDEVKPVKFRKGDYWPELADAFNRVSDRIKALEQKAEEAANSSLPANLPFKSSEHVGAG